ncbi:MAG TPA: pyruvate kinase [Nitrospira sp.]|uniref:pyruvate kinase n=1 Tax=Cognatazoarcus halotolerans TaxID=2686016 RepID=UPI001356779A|nr:pyruvate kinase [Cognatazoarcus halotolerans]MBX3680150.1 pyruvate kinase [Rhodocyclaceae bacterium]MCB1898314.1 pyruvate kinase [Rhodocyclaceae bacterium]MCP5308474.1 pyruvate kinase [Zoogloeaceae bacterium]HQV11425.1 pyruvate kinase [Nitrospira sp.]
MPRHTKIVATLGPASTELSVLERMVHAGVDVVRMNFSHGSAADHASRAETVREASARAGRPVGILADLQGPKIRIGKFEQGRIRLERDATFILDARCEIGDQTRVGLDYKDLPKDVRTGDILLLDDGRLKLDVMKVLASEIHCRVRVGGELSNNKGINRQGGGLTAPALTAKDMDDIKTAASIGVDFVAVSFPKSSADMYMARQLMRAAGCQALLIAKIERTEAVANLEEIVEASDGIMVARGDLAVEVGDAAVPALQKRMIRTARERNKLTITATQMMESMITSPVPTRAEVSDVANAVLDGTDAVMLSAETAAGKYPVEVVEAMSRVCLEAEKSTDFTLDREVLNRVFTRIDQSIAMAAIWTAYHLNVKAIASLTQTGSTALWMSRLSCGVSIYALTPETSARNQMTLYRGVYPLLMSQLHSERDVLLWEAEQILMDQGVVVHGDLIVLTIGEPIGASGGTNTLKIVRVGEHPAPTAEL